MQYKIYMLYTFSMAKTVSINLLLDDELLERIEEYRHANKIASRLEAIRELLARGLSLKGGKK